MAYICYFDDREIPESDGVRDNDNILRIHRVNSRVMKNHYELYRSLMIAKGPLSLSQREMIATVVSVSNTCRY